MTQHIWGGNLSIQHDTQIYTDFINMWFTVVIKSDDFQLIVSFYINSRNWGYFALNKGTHQRGMLTQKRFDLPLKFAGEHINSFCDKKSENKGSYFCIIVIRAVTSARLGNGILK